MYMNNAQISLAYNGIFSSVETAAMGLGPILGVLGWKAITAGIRWYKSYKVRKNQIKSLIDIFTLFSKGWFDSLFTGVHRALSDQGIIYIIWWMLIIFSISYYIYSKLRMIPFSKWCLLKAVFFWNTMLVVILAKILQHSFTPTI